jgi:elongation factor P hydroxylase
MNAALGRSAERFQARLLEQLFEQGFAAGFRTRLQGGAQEPFYAPAKGAQDWSVIYYRADYFASALHEVAHWCIAGAERRRLADYGYWYEPDTRAADAQRRFLAVEARPQALEWLFARAAGYPFRLSLDNPDADPRQEQRDRAAFAAAVLAAAQRYQSVGLPMRARQFCQGLQRYFGGVPHDAATLTIGELR